MRVSFDLDDTLVCVGGPTDDLPASFWPLRLWRKWRYREPLRRGTRELMTALAARGCEVWIYTTSDRDGCYLLSWFRCHGITIAGVVNQPRHLAVVGRTGPSKYPPAFQIDLHVDDLEGVRIEGARHGFDVLVIAPDDPHWATRVLAAVETRLAQQTK